MPEKNQESEIKSSDFSENTGTVPEFIERWKKTPKFWADYPNFVFFILILGRSADTVIERRDSAISRDRKTARFGTLKPFTIGVVFS